MSGTALIKTTRLDECNYGGLLQAFALQGALHSLGWPAVVDRSWPYASARHRLSRTAWSVVERMSPNLLLTPRRLEDARRRRVRDFIDEDLLTTSLFGPNGRARPDVVAGVENFVVGSDQVWRPHDTVGSCLLDFLPEDVPGRRIAYGASFGVASLDQVGAARLGRLRGLARRFDSISVRETSGVRICEELWDVRATHVVDPVLLHPASFYEEHLQIDLNSPEGGSGSLMYILDASPAKLALCKQASRVTASPMTSMLPDGPTGPSQFRQNRARFLYPSVREWLSKFAGSETVVTDSYHGVVLSLLLRKPFVAIENAQRGASRFESLLALVGLEERLVAEDSQSIGALLSPIDWADVSKRLALHQAESWRFLSDATDPSRRSPLVSQT